MTRRELRNARWRRRSERFCERCTTYDERRKTISMEGRQVSDAENKSAPRLRLPTWLRPPIKHGHAYSLQFLPLYFVIAMLVFLLLGNGIEYLLPAATPRLWGALLAKIVMVIAITLPAFAISRVEGRPFGSYGLPAGQAFRRLFWLGVLWGFV